MSEHSTDAVALLKNLGMRSTQCRLDILNYLQSQHSPSNIEMVWLALGKVYDQATIYRNLRDFLKAKLVDGHDFGDRKKWFSLSGPDAQHRHYLRCFRCQNTVEIDHCIWPDLDVEISSRYGFSDVRHQLEFSGICPECDAKEQHSE